MSTEEELVVLRHIKKIAIKKAGWKRSSTDKIISSVEAITRLESSKNFASIVVSVRGSKVEISKHWMELDPGFKSREKHYCWDLSDPEVFEKLRKALKEMAR